MGNWNKKQRMSVTLTGSSDLIGANLGPLVLANPILEKMEIRRLVNLHCPADPRLEIPIGNVICALAANRLCSPEPLMHVAEWAENSGAEFILGTPAEALNDDRLARALDAVFQKRWNILADVALHVSRIFNVSLAKVHYDPTSFHFTGQYDHQSESPSLLPELKPFKIEVGRHARPGLDIKEAQVGVDLANDGKGPVPFFYHSADGSANGHIAVAKNLQNMLKYIKPKKLLLITDRGCFSAEQAMDLVRKHHFDFISSLTWTKDLADLYDRKKPDLKEASFLSLKEQLKREAEKPPETWEKYFIGEIPYTITHEQEVETSPGDTKTEKCSIRARLIYVFSTADQKVCRKTRVKYTNKIAAGLSQIQNSVQNGYLKDVQAVDKRVSALYGKKAARHYFNYQVRALTAQDIDRLPLRRRGQRKPALKFSYQYHDDRAQKDARYDGLYAICTSLSKKTHSTDEVFTAFKEQHHIETAHHQWKAPIRLRPLFLKKVIRIESLVFVQFLALMAFYLLQRSYRLAKGACCRATGETLLKCFSFTPIAINYHPQSVQVTPFPLKKVQIEILKMLGFPLLEGQICSSVTRPDSDASHSQREI
jgi:transposase